MKKDLTFLKGLYIAHRGLHDNIKHIPENSLLAFKNAIASKRAIELDIHILKDDEIVIFHDDNLKRMTGYDKEIKNCTYREIKNLKLLYTNEKIPLLREVLDLVDGKVLIDIEFKTDVKTGRLEEKASELLDNYKGSFIVKSFNPCTVKWFKDNRPNFIRGQLSCDFRNMKMNKLKKFVLTDMVFNFITKPDFVAYDINSITEKQKRKWKNKDKCLLLWTIRTEDELEKAKECGSSFIYEKIKI